MINYKRSFLHLSAVYSIILLQPNLNDIENRRYACSIVGIWNFPA